MKDESVKRDIDRYNIRCSSLSKNIKLNDGGQVTIAKKIGCGNFGEIWLGINNLTGEKYAVKCERSRSTNSPLIVEYKIYKILGKCKFIPIIYNFVQCGRYNLLTMELLGMNLEEILSYNKNSISVKSALLIGMQAIKIFEYVHSKGIIYRDVKPQNFLIGNTRENEQRLYLIDFGLCKEYINKITNCHIPYCEGRSLTGTARYMSINTHLGKEQSRRDDLESIGYMLIYLLKGSLPWQGLKVEVGQNHYEKIASVKQQIPLYILNKDLPVVFEKYLSYCKNLDFYEKPEYEFLHHLFFQYYKLQKYSGECFDFTTYQKSYQPDSEYSSLVYDDITTRNLSQIYTTGAKTKGCSDASFKPSDIYRSSIYNEKYPSKPSLRDYFNSSTNKISVNEFNRGTFFHRFKNAFKYFFSKICFCYTKPRKDPHISVYSEPKVVT